MKLTELVTKVATEQSLTRDVLVQKVIQSGGLLVVGTEDPGPTDVEVEAAVDAAIADGSIEVRTE